MPMKKPMREVILTMALLCAAPVCEAQVTYTWKGGDGNWSDPAMWTASDGSTDTYPSDDTIHGAFFLSNTTATVTIDQNNIAVSNLIFLGANSDITFKSQAGSTNTMTYRAVRTYDASTAKYTDWTGTNATLTLDAVKLKLKIGNDTGRLFTASTANSIPINIRRLQGPKADSRIVLRNGSYFSALAIESVGARCTFDISGESEIHSVIFHSGAGGEVALSNGYLSVWYVYFDTHSFASDSRIVFRGDHPRVVYGRCGGRDGYANLAYPTWVSATKTYVPDYATFYFHLPAEPYAYAPVANAYYGSENTAGFPGGSYRMSDSGQANLYIAEGTLRVKIMNESPARLASASESRNYRLIDWSGMSWKQVRLGITETETVEVLGLKGRDSVFTEVREGWESVELPQYFGVTLAPKSGLAIIYK